MLQRTNQRGADDREKPNNKKSQQPEKNPLLPDHSCPLE